MKRLIFLFVFLYLFFLHSAYAEEYVSIDYPGGIVTEEDTQLPGVPSETISEYKKELRAWGVDAGFYLTDEMIEHVIEAPYSAGLSDNTTNAFIAEDGTQQNALTFDTSRPLWKMMRDVVFLETLAYSSYIWELNYIGQMASGTTQPAEAYDLAKEINKEYRAYLSESSIKSSPIVSAIIGAGGTSYMYNLAANEGSLESYTEDQLKEFIDNGASMFDEGLANGLDLTASGAVGFVTNTAVEFIKEQSSAEFGLALDVIGGIKNAVAGGIGAVLAPAEIYYATASYMSGVLTENSAGAHLILHYYLNKKYYEDLYGLGNYPVGANPSPILDGVISLNKFSINANAGRFSSSSINDDIFQALAASNFNFLTAASDDQAKAAYAISSMMRLSQNLDLKLMKANLAAYAFLKSKEAGILSASSTNNVGDLASQYYDHALLSNKIYNEGYTTVGKTDTVYGSDWVLDHYWSTDNGFSAGLYRNSRDETIITIGGTLATVDEYDQMGKIADGIVDIITDVTLFSNLGFRVGQDQDLLDFLD